jgi:predicted pyridoxine 5'-phosphate oxidase superfamily flavin-nucleotide-binding protein
MTQLPGWSRPSSPFHAGEQLVQRRLGVRERMETVGRRVLRNFMPDQHREFFAGLPFLVLAAIDGEGQPWAAAVTGAPGFLSTPDDMTLRVAAEAPADLAAGADIGAVGIDFAARRRNRANGVVAGIGEGSFDIAVRQSFGNCPKYIQARHWTMLGAGEHSPGRVVRQRGLGATERTLIAAADTFFIASALGSVRDRPSQGADASHRGGPPGFVRVDDERTLAVPDFTGNSYFNTLGNLALNPRCGLLFIDFATGTTPRPRSSGRAPRFDASPAPNASSASASETARPSRRRCRCAGALATSRPSWRSSAGGTRRPAPRRHHSVTEASSC